MMIRLSCASRLVQRVPSSGSATAAAHASAPLTPKASPVLLSSSVVMMPNRAYTTVRKNLYTYPKPGQRPAGAPASLPFFPANKPELFDSRNRDSGSRLGLLMSWDPASGLPQARIPKPSSSSSTETSSSSSYSASPPGSSSSTQQPQQSNSNDPNALVPVCRRAQLSHLDRIINVSTVIKIALATLGPLTCAELHELMPIGSVPPPDVFEERILSLMIAHDVIALKELHAHTRAVLTSKPDRHTPVAKFYVVNMRRFALVKADENVFVEELFTRAEYDAAQIKNTDTRRRKPAAAQDN